jgi:hypothetical protein
MAVASATPVRTTGRRDQMAWRQFSRLHAVGGRGRQELKAELRWNADRLLGRAF